jgi:predicted RecA/RadA family phage recombinase
MSRNYESDGNVIQWTNNTGGAVPAGRLIKLGNMLGVVLVTLAIGETGSVAVEGVFSGVPKVSAAVFVQGEKLIFDVSANGGLGAFDDSLATPAAGDVTGGAIAWVAGANGETVCTIKLSPGNTAVA